MKRLALIALLAGAPSLVSCTGEVSGPDLARASSAAPAVDANVPAPGKLITLNVKGMSCPIGCPPQVKSALGGVEGVTRVEVDYEKKQALVVVEREDFDASRLLAALASTQFKESSLATP